MRWEPGEGFQANNQSQKQNTLRVLIATAFRATNSIEVFCVMHAWQLYKYIYHCVELLKTDHKKHPVL